MNKILILFRNECDERRDGTNGEPQLLASCYRNCLQFAVENQIQTIVFPSISTGVYGYPILKANQIAVREVKNFLVNNSVIKHVSFVFFLQRICMYTNHCLNND